MPSRCFEYDKYVKRNKSKTKAITMRLLCELLILSIIQTVLGIDPTVSIDETSPPTEITPLGVKTMTVVKNSDAYLTCVVHNKQPDRDVEWIGKVEVPGLVVPTIPISTGPNSKDPFKYQLDVPSALSWRLKIQNVQTTDEMKYRCQVLIGNQTYAFDERTIRVTTAPQIDDLRTSSDMTVSVGDPVELRCNATGRPFPVVKWQKLAGGLLPTGGREHRDFILNLGEAKSQHRGSYKCTAQNEQGIAQRIVSLTVKFETTTLTPPAPERSDISCDPDSITAFVPESMLPPGSPLTWRDPGCSVTSNGTHLVSTIGHNQCGTTVTIRKDTVEFENELVAHMSNNTASLIDFGDNSYVIPVKCIYPRHEQAMTSYQPMQQHVRFYEKRYGHFDVDIIQYNSEKFSTPIQNLGAPRKVPLKTPIYIEVQLNSQYAGGLGIHVDKCIATPTPSPSDSTYITLLVDGCPGQPYVHVHKTTPTKVHFSVKAFEFLANASAVVYVHCQASVCDSGTPYCMSNCVVPGRRKRDVASYRKSHLVSTGPFVLAADERGFSVQSSTLVAAVSAMVAVLACVIAIIGWTRRHPKPPVQEKKVEL